MGKYIQNLTYYFRCISWAYVTSTEVVLPGNWHDRNWHFKMHGHNFYGLSVVSKSAWFYCQMCHILGSIQLVGLTMAIPGLMPM